MKQESFNPIYNEVGQVRHCASSMLCGAKIKNVNIGIVIGFNGTEFVTSTDWRLETEDGMKQILPFSIQTQYPSFVECKAGIQYSQFQGSVMVLPDGNGVKKDTIYVRNNETNSFVPVEALVVDNKSEPKEAIILLDSKEYHFVPGEDLIIKIDPEEKFLATDCPVECTETKKTRIYTINTKNAKYGILKDGKISQAQ